MNSNIRIAGIGFKQCGGRSCTNEGRFLLTIKYINKKGWFCESCKTELEMDGLVLLNK